jgi:hypothetical protein
MTETTANGLHHCKQSTTSNQSELSAAAILERELISMCDLMDALDHLIWEPDITGEVQVLVRFARYQAKVVRYLASMSDTEVSAFTCPEPLHEESPAAAARRPSWAPFFTPKSTTANSD